MTVCGCGCGFTLSRKNEVVGFIPSHQPKAAAPAPPVKRAVEIHAPLPPPEEEKLFQVAITIHRCAICGEPPNARGCVVRYEDTKGGEVWGHRLCVARRKP